MRKLKINKPLSTKNEVWNQIGLSAYYLTRDKTELRARNQVGSQIDYKVYDKIGDQIAVNFIF